MSNKSAEEKTLKLPRQDTVDEARAALIRRWDCGWDNLDDAKHDIDALILAVSGQETAAVRPDPTALTPRQRAAINGLDATDAPADAP